MVMQLRVNKTVSWLGLLALLSSLPLLVGSLPTVLDERQSRLRAANAAFTAGALEEAARGYTKLQPLMTDPGQVAFNLATTYYHQQRFAEAEDSYRRCLADQAIPPQRQAAALYNLANCLVLQAGPIDVDRLRQAIDAYQKTLKGLPVSETLRRQAVYNLELTKQLWHATRQRSPRPTRPNERPEEMPRLPRLDWPQDLPPNLGDPASASGEDAIGEAGPVPEPAPGTAEGAATAQQVPGAGNLPVLPDEEELLPLSPEQVQQYLEQINRRLQRERRNLSRTDSGTERPDVRNW